MQFFKNILGSLSILLLLPSEIKGQCTKPTTSDNAGVHKDDILKDTFEEGSKIRLQCHPGYEPSSGTIRSRLTCSGGQWDPPGPERFICKKKSCGNPGEVPNGDYDTSGGVEFGATITAVCKTGYLIIGENTRTCMADGQWDGREAVCEAVKCGPPPDVPNGRLKLPPNDEYEYSHAVQYVCNNDYTLVGDEDPKDTVHCREDGNWSEKPRCTKVECPRPDIPNAKRIQGNSGPYGYLVTLVYECVVGYKMTTPHNNRMVCLEHGWSDNLACEVVKCPQPGATNATIAEGAGGSYKFGDVVKYDCPAEQKRVGSHQLRCESSGRWSSNPPVCLKVVDCPQPGATNAITEGAGGPYRVGVIVRYSCQIGHRLVGSSELKCGSDEQWSSNPPVCEVVKCPQPGATNATIAEGAGDSYKFGDVVKYDCPAEQKRVGSHQLRCESNGQWSSNPPVCLKAEDPPSHTLSNGEKIAVAVPVTLGVVVGGIIFFFWKKKKKKEEERHTGPPASEAKELQPLSSV